MEFRDLKKQYKALKQQIDEAIQQVLTEASFINGRQVSELEHNLAEYVGVKHCISCANGTDAITVPLMALGIKKGDAVFVPAFTFFATAEAVALVGATPVFVDVLDDTFNIDAVSLENSIIKTKSEGKLRAAAVIAVDLFGLPADYPTISEVCKRHGLTLIEDGAQGFGGRIGQKRVCSFGDISTTSFFPAKPLGCYGDGGAMFTDDDELAKTMRSICFHGKGSHKYDNVRIGLNSRLDTIQAAVLNVKLKAFAEYELTDVNKIAEQYTQHLQHTKYAQHMKLPHIPHNYYSSWAQYTLKLESYESREMFLEKMAAANVPVQIYFPKPMHLQKAFDYLGYEEGSLPVSERLSKTVASIPIGPYLDEQEISSVVAAINN